MKPVLAWVTALACVMGATSATTANADASSVEQSLAQVLFAEGRALMDKGDVPAACRRFERSQKLDPAGGTLLNLALCHEREGKLATAWLEYHDALAASTRDGRSDRETFARTQLEGLDARVPRISIRGMPCTACQIFLDGRNVDRAAIGVVTPLDPGEHSVVVRTSSGRDGVPRKFRLAEAQVVAIDLPEGPTEAPDLRVTAAPSSSRRTIGFVSLAVSGVALGLGTYFGVRAVSLGNEADAVCPSTSCNDAGAVSLSQEADTHAWAANAAIGTAVLAGGIGVYLLLTSRTPSPAARNAMSGRIEF